MEELIVAAVVTLAALTLARRYRRVFSRRTPADPPCAEGCGGCATDEPTCAPPPRPRSGPFVVLALIAVVVGGAPGAARAADTTEPFALGATDVDVYFGVDGLEAAPEERVLYGDILLGYGLTERLSGFLGVTLEADGRLGGSSPHVHLGGYGCVVDTEHVDLDLMLHVGTGGAAFDEFEIVPGAELNLDADPDMATWGSYLRLAVPVLGRPAPDGSGANPSVAIELTAGGYVMVAEGHQLVVELDAAFRPDPPPKEEPAELGGLALGYNATLSENLELITQLAVDLPQGGDPAAGFGVMAGVIATLPAAD